MDKEIKKKLVMSGVTGEIREADITDAISISEAVILSRPKRSCKKCLGRGTIGRNVDAGFMVPCRCVFRKED